MRLKSVLGLAYCLMLAGMVDVSAGSPTAVPPQEKKVTPPQKFTPNNSYPPALYRRNDISNTLNLNKDQIQRLNQLTDQTRNKYRTAYDKLGTLDEPARTARLQELNREYYNDWSKGAKDILNETQRNRYHQLNYQYGGFNSLYNPEVQKRLNLTANQMEKLRESVNWNNQQLQNIRNTAATDPTRASQLYNTYWQQRQQQFNNFLTPAQQQMWREMTGEPYKFQPNFTPPK